MRDPFPPHCGDPRRGGGDRPQHRRALGGEETIEVGITPAALGGAGAGNDAAILPSRSTRSRPPPYSAHWRSMSLRQATQSAFRNRAFRGSMPVARRRRSTARRASPARRHVSPR